MYWSGAVSAAGLRGLTHAQALARFVIFVIGGVLGTVFGVALGFFIFPCVFPPPPAAEMLTEADRARLVATGTFIHANPSDPIHYGSGKVSVYERAVFLEPDFEVGPGPAFHVYLVPKASIRSSSDIKDVMFVDLGGCARSRAVSVMRSPPASTCGISERHHLVRALRRADLAGGFEAAAKVAEGDCTGVTAAHDGDMLESPLAAFAAVSPPSCSSSPPWRCSPR